jgi:hypothetical protein
MDATTDDLNLVLEEDEEDPDLAPDYSTDPVLLALQVWQRHASHRPDVRRHLERLAPLYEQMRAAYQELFGDLRGCFFLPPPNEHLPQEHRDTLGLLRERDRLAYLADGVRMILDELPSAPVE